jgi:maleamate amidohydrolase
MQEVPLSDDLSADLSANYANVYNGSLGFGDSPVLLLVDVCEAYVDPDSPLYAGVEDSADVMRELVTAARANEVPVIFTRVVYEPGGANGGYFYKKVPVLNVFDEGSKFGAWLPGLAPEGDERVVTKQYPSAFVGTDLANELHEQGVDTVIICGWSTSGCVRATGVDTVSYGFIPIVVRDGVGDRHPEPHEANLFDLQSKYADVVDSSEVLAYFEKFGTNEQKAGSR